MEWKSGLIVYDGNHCEHFVLYHCEDPTNQIEILRKELNEDEEFGYVGRADNLYIRVMTPEELVRGILIYMDIKTQ